VVAPRRRLTPLTEHLEVDRRLRTRTLRCSGVTSGS
jgi:hypothetical protein